MLTSSSSSFSGFQSVFMSEFVTNCARGMNARQSFYAANNAAIRVCDERAAIAADQVLSLEGVEVVVPQIVKGDFPRKATFRWVKGEKWPTAI